MAAMGDSLNLERGESPISGGEDNSQRREYLQHVSVEN